MQIKQAIFSAFIVIGISACGGGGGGNQVQGSEELKPFFPNAGLTKEDEATLVENSSSTQRKYDNEWVGSQRVISLENLNNGNLAKLLTTDVRGNSRENYSLPDISNQKYQTLDPSTKDGQIGNVLYFNRTAHDPKTGTSLSYKVFMSDDSYKYTQFTMVGNPHLPAIGGFYRGNTTNVSDMPTSGQMKYKGEMVAIMGDTSSANIGAVSADVDFGSKFINFDFNVGDRYREKLSAKIVGSVFGGSNGFINNSNANKAKSVVGAFAGPHAEEMSGSLIDMEKKVLANFAAKRQ